ncbi:hypothetical protein [Nisaea sp.]|uniref:hypothetical protein n=1 Tax=Nisaea sp. TaxID=2024842 RepID=UPI003297D596
MTKKLACPTAASLADMIILPRAEAELLLAVYRAFRKHFNIVQGTAVGNASDARRKFFDLVKDGGDPADLEITALIDGGSGSSCMKPEVVSERTQFKTPAPVDAGIVMNTPHPRRRTTRPARR